MSDGRGIPLLSGPPPEYTANEPSCRKCNKEFNILFARSRKCNHCGYSYCHSCSDYQALMPRRGNESGYDPVPVCGFCIELLQITAAGKGQLKQLPMAKLKRYAKAYNIDVGGVIEKDDFIERLIAARMPNGCLPTAKENHYRKGGVPNRAGSRPRGLFTRAMDAMSGSPPSPSSSRQQPQSQYTPHPPYQPRQRTTSGPSRFPRPDLDPRDNIPPQQQQAYYHQQQAPRPPPPHANTRPPQQPQPQQQRYAPPPGYPPHYAHPYPQPYHQPQPQPSRPSNLNVPPPGRPRSASATAPATPRTQSPPTVQAPNIDALLAMPDAELSRLSVGVLKEILFVNHVNPGPVVEKGDLVARVRTLVEQERRERERHAQEEEEERLYEEEMQRAREEERRASEERRAAREAGAQPVPAPQPQAQEGASTSPPVSTPPQGSASESPASTLTPKAQAMATRLERTGLCVICQDEEANIAIVDCGHLALCRGCSDLIMKSTRECPLCRTRIVTESRLLRIFKT